MDSSLLTNGIFIATLIWLGHFISGKIKINSLLSFLIIGLFIGPSSLGLLDKNVSFVLAEIGIMFLLFLIGLHIDFSEMKDIKKYMLKLGILQLSITTGLLFFLFISIYFIFSFHLSIVTNIFVSMTLSLSSTAIIMQKIISDNLMNTELGSAKLGILIFQDIVAPIILVFIPVLAKGSLTFDGFRNEVFIIIGSMCVLILTITILYKYIFLKILIDNENSNYKGFNALSIAIIALICGGIANYFGISYGIGAFIGGIIAGMSEFKNNLIDKMEGIKDIFLALFFVYIGMLIDLNIIWDNLLIIIFLTIAIKTIKVMGTFLSCRILKINLKNSFIIGTNLSQVSEFSFVLISTLLLHNMFSEETFQILNAVIILTMIISMFLIEHSERISNYIFKNIND